VAVIKYNTYQKEKIRKWKEDILRTDNWEYDRNGNYYICPNGRKLTWRGEERKYAFRICNNS